MIPEVGEFALILAFCLSALLAVVPLYGATVNNELWMNYAKPLARGQFLFVAISFVCLSYAFSQDDFTVKYVAEHSNSQLPMQFKLSAVWGGHEGSLLLWAFILSGWTVAVSIFSRALPLDMLARVLGVMGIIAVGFILFLLETSSPFLRLLPEAPADGVDLNPLLQDVGLIVHPPMLYMGYVGFSVAFAFAIAALLSGRLDAAWARWSRPWTNLAWAFLGMGITLGSWWAYYELGWGGWWFWDPVENASLMPWLVGTALIHSLAVTEKRGVFKSWTVLLAIFAFSLSLLGTFLVRSGVLTSVHAFASDPKRGLFILVLLAITIGGSLTLYAFKAPNVKSASLFSWLSRETLLLVNNLFLTVMAFTVLLGTLYPLLIDALKLGKISVGPPYFNALFVPIMGAMTVALGITTAARWRETSDDLLLKTLWKPAVLSLLFGLIIALSYGKEFHLAVLIGMILSFWVIFTTGVDFVTKFNNASSVVEKLKQLSPSYYGMVLAHLGVAVVAIGITLVSHYSEERDIRMAKGDTLDLAGYHFEFQGTTRVNGENYVAEQGALIVTQNGAEVTTLKPEKRNYNVKRSMMTEAAIDAGLWRDLYVALGEPLEGGAWAVRIQYKPFVRWLWLGGILIAAGGLLTVADKRYRKKKVETKHLKTFKFIALVHWLFYQPRYAWLCIVSVVIPFFSPSIYKLIIHCSPYLHLITAEQFIRYMGLIFQFLGIATVILDISGRKKLFEYPSFLNNVKVWFKRCPCLHQPINSAEISITLGGLEGSAYGNLSTIPNATLEERLTHLENTVNSIWTGINQDRENTKQEFKNALQNEQQSRQAADNQVLDKLKATATDGIHISLIGAIWLIEGVILSTAAIEIAELLK